MRWIRKMKVALVTLALGLLITRAEVAHASEAAPPAWCVEGSEPLDNGVCYYAPAPAPDNQATPAPCETLVIFLHSLVAVDSNWQWEQQRLMLRTAERMGFAVLIPRGRPGIGPGAQQNVLAWPGSPRMQEAFEASLLAEWDQAKASVESRRGAPFPRTLVFGFSNGAYYATSLAVRARYAADGYGIFAGGSGSKFNRILANNVEKRAPIFVGYGTKDPASAHMNSLVRMLADLHWPHAVKRAAIGHWVSDAQLQSAVRFLTHTAASSAP